ncbi:MAG TPA: Ig-like domain-containing protein [Chthonomonadaceae bacterium]|nr:Ig-like domain-containing protein [Chthonomonadaceae bacterium]
MANRVALWISALLTVSGIAARAETTLTVALTAKPEASASKPVALDPAKLSDVVRVQARADSSAGIARVTFEVDDQFRIEVKQPPYLYDWDTVEEDDGAHTVAVIAYDTNGQTAVKRLKVTVDNQLSLGIKAHAARALEAFRRGDYAEVDREARRAYKISTADPEAARVMALSIGIKGDLTRAFQILDDPQIKIPPGDPITVEVRSFLLLARAATTLNLATMAGDIQNALPILRKQAESALQAARATDPADYAGLLARGDALFTYRDFDGALDSYQRALKLASPGAQKRRAQHRVALAMLKIGRIPEVELMLTSLVNGPDGNATSSALLGMTYFQNHRYPEARRAVESGVQARNVASLLVAALSDLAIGANARAYAEAKQAVNAADTAQTQVVAQAVLADTGDKEGTRRSFQIAFLRAPLFFPSLLERAYDHIAYDKSDDRFAQALAVFDLVLRYEPDNAAAMAGRLAALIQLRRRKTAAAALSRLIELDRFAPDVFILQAAYYNEDNKQQRVATESLALARKQLPEFIKDFTVPRIPAFAPRLVKMRRIVPLTPELLDLADDIQEARAE